MNRTRRLSFAIALLALSASVDAQELTLERVADGLGSATSLCAPPADTQRLFVTTTDGAIHVIEDGVLLPNLFLDLSGVVASGNQGLLGMTFHPDYASNGRFFVVYLDNTNNSSIVEYQVSSDPNVADQSSATHILGPFQQIGVVHFWNCLKFGPDGMLYVSTGDGGGYHGFPASNGAAQDITNTQGKILRLDVDIPFPHIPADNPFVGVPNAAEEIWVYGLRQPWRFAFDALTGDVFIGDVGQTTREELDFIPGGDPGGINFGWFCKEGTTCTGVTGCDCSNQTFTDPVLEYAHAGGLCCIIGGEVYRGGAMPALQGTYFYGDYCSGRVWSLRYDGTTLSEHIERSQEFIATDGTQLSVINSFGVDAEGELYVIANFPSEVFKVIPAANCGTSNYCQPSSPNSAGSGSLLTVSGSASFTTNDFLLEVNGGVPNQFGIFFYGPNTVQVPLGDGYRCVGGMIRRLNPPILTHLSGYSRRPIDLANQGPGPNTITPGSTWHFQYWHRDPNGPGGTGSNLSDGLTATFCP